jgi:hypothetical protein
MNLEALAFVERCQADRSRMIQELQSYEPVGVMHLWKGRSAERLHDVTEDRVDSLRRELARVDAMIEFVNALSRVL